MNSLSLVALNKVRLSSCSDNVIYAIVQLVPRKTLQSLRVKFRVINESFETNLDCTMITRD